MPTRFATECVLKPTYCVLYSSDRSTFHELFAHIFFVYAAQSNKWCPSSRVTNQCIYFPETRVLAHLRGMWAVVMFNLPFLRVLIETSAPGMRESAAHLDEDMIGYGRLSFPTILYDDEELKLQAVCVGFTVQSTDEEHDCTLKI